MDGFYSFVELMHKGKTVNYILLLLYGCVLFAAVERTVYYTRTFYKRKTVYRLLKEYEKRVFDNIPVESNFFDQKGAAGSCIAVTAHTFFEYRFKPPQVLAAALERTAQTVIREQEKGFVLLSRIASAAPLLGLLGTVTGLMAAFQKIAVLGGSVDISVLSGGIWEAMITTATGLVTAVCAFFFYELFDWVNIRRIRDVEYAVSVFCQQNDRDQGEMSSAAL